MNESEMRRCLFIDPFLPRHFGGNFVVWTVRKKAEGILRADKKIVVGPRNYRKSGTSFQCA